MVYFHTQASFYYIFTYREKTEPFPMTQLWLITSRKKRMNCSQRPKPHFGIQLPRERKDWTVPNDPSLISEYRNNNNLSPHHAGFVIQIQQKTEINIHTRLTYIYKCTYIYIYIFPKDPSLILLYIHIHTRLTFGILSYRTYIKS